MINLVTSFINKHQLLRKDATVLVGVSGGPDSMALLHFLCTIRREWNLKLIAIGLDHQLRGEASLADMDYVRHVCIDWNIKFIETSIDVPSYKQERQIGTEIAAREVRYRFFAQQMNHFQADYLALGHHGDDQVETMLMGLARSASSSAFAGIPIKRNFATGEIIRPLLCVTKATIEAYCQVHQITPRIDSTNQETMFTRNYFRKHVVPLLKEKNGNIHTTVQHLSETIHEDELFLQAEANKMMKNTVQFNKESKIATLKIDHYKSRPLALQRRVFHLILNYLYDGFPKDLSYIHEEYLFALMENEKSNAQIDFPRQLKVEKSYGELAFYFLTQPSYSISYHEVLKVPGQMELPDGSILKASFTENPPIEKKHAYCCDVEQVDLPLHIRTRQPGDRMRWKGLNGSKKLKDIFIDAKIPLKERDKWPIVVDNNGEILWLVGLKKGRPGIQSKQSRYIQLDYQQAML